MLQEKEDQYSDFVENNPDLEMEIEEVLDVYESTVRPFVISPVTSDSSWGKVLWPCSCVTSHGLCGCKHAALVTFAFDPSIAVPRDNVAADSVLSREFFAIRPRR